MAERRSVDKRVTSHEVALRAGVSQSTVSRALAGDPRLSEATRLRVLEIARSLGYKPNAIARSLITKRTNIVGLVASNMANPFYPLVLEAFTQHLHSLGWRVLLFTAGSREDVDDLLPEVLAYQVDGLIIVSAAMSSRMARECVGRGTPVVLFNRYVPDSGASAVSCDNRGGGRKVAEALLRAGYRRLAYIAGREDASTSVDRERGFGEALLEHGVKTWLREPGNFSYEAGFNAAMRLLRLDEPPEAIFCANDITAIGAIDAARKLKVRVPEDLAVIGFDDIPAASWAAYNLTTVRQPIERMIEASVRLLLGRIEDPSLAAVNEFIPGELVRRGSARLDVAPKEG
ncbi:LacI family DNA-binding transcriptional regulator [Calidithermus roseus]|uniref:Putative HTH-type transcriptional repressor ExuR n=1 Tax=Calidithermus roseus TaxID=1644118 RepID=A0A399EW36_9DEIN|nr:LacI family DNA-binding transcriptional regulator [Calidithermus roseus]RIH87893.1 putative HTH-type transcriptional repressor ExuR [Calidithermus roseus]